MTPSSDQHDRLERTIHRTLSDLPPRRAPRSLENRVLAEIARLSALPWWRKSFAHWPMPARGGFLVLSTAIASLVLLLTVWGGEGLDALSLRSIFAQQFAWMENGLTVFRALKGFGEIIARNVPPIWFYGGLALIASAYATFFGLGAAAYKTLYAQR
jgi:hypothetical protein